ncbi:enoyl-CoA hydratase-related protein [Sphingomonas crocodyli]|uniref:2-(1,2-epoxy-1,2-dihydrophenyl)acetyl-CoA isomerase n=1 Tax=Sphingomonas crocodyli TaxID=1979270 RepID=A0A437M443_9SPHN|nr:enoyl-CoA hydratase-related protein [Sphingomonas crocodyli]RVT92470.1 2-(1,2-epoxy-1,2-dihydrophenyl)acetyl-CoA isomerase [Sphingomonas crocodyli]
MSYETIKLDLTDGVATLTLNRPDRLNALTPHLFDEATAAIDGAIAAGARALVITGEGRAFCSGADLQARGDAGLPSDLGLIVDEAYNPFAKKIAGLDIPVITAINGIAAGAGASIALSGDISVMARSAYVLLAFVNIGLVPDAGATWFVAKGAGRVKALEMALLGEKLFAEDAKEAGLITRVVDDEKVLEEAQAIAAKLARGPTIAIGMIRKQVALALNSSLSENLQIERDNQSAAGKTADFAEAVKAFGEKRPPQFEGR